MGTSTIGESRSSNYIPDVTDAGPVAVTAGNTPSAPTRVRRNSQFAGLAPRSVSPRIGQSNSIKKIAINEKPWDQGDEFVTGLPIKFVEIRLEILRCIYNNKFDEADKGLTFLFQDENADNEVKKWAESVSKMINAITQLPQEARLSSKKMIRDILGEDTKEIYSDIEKMALSYGNHSDFVGLLKKQLLPYQSLQVISQRLSSENNLDIDANQSAIIHQLAADDPKSAMAGLSVMANTIPKENVGLHNWIKKFTEIAGNMCHAFPSRFQSITADLMLSVKNGGIDEAHLLLENFVNSSLQSDAIDDDAGLWVALATELIESVGRYFKSYHGKIRSDIKLEITKKYLQRDLKSADRELTSLSENFADDQDLQEWIDDTRKLIKGIKQYVKLEDKISDNLTISNLVEGKPLDQDSCIQKFFEKSDSTRQAYDIFFRSVPAVMQPFDESVYKVNPEKNISDKDKYVIARHLVAGEYEDAQISLAQLICFENLTDKAKDWSGQCALFIAEMELSPPEKFEKLHKKIMRAIANGNPEQARYILEKAFDIPENYVDDDPARDRWVLTMSRSITFIGVPLLVEQIYEHLERKDVDTATDMIHDLVQYQTAERSDVGLSPEVMEMLEILKDTGALAYRVEPVVEEVVRPSIEPEENDHIEDGLFLNSAGNAIVDIKGHEKLGDAKYDMASRVVTSAAGAYIGYLSSGRRGRIHCDDEWKTKIGPIMKQARTEAMFKALQEAANNHDHGSRNSQKTLKDNMGTLARIKIQAKLGLQQGSKFSPLRAVQVLWEDLDIGAGVDLLYLLWKDPETKMPITPGKAVNAIGKSFKRAITNRVTGTKSEYKQRLALLIDETKLDVERLHPDNKLACSQIRDLIFDSTERLNDDIKPSDPKLEEIDGMFEKHQGVLSINHNPPRVLVDRKSKNTAISEIPNDVSRKKISLAYDQYEENSIPGSRVARKRTQILFWGPPGSGKSYAGRKAGNFFDGGKNTYEMPPTINSINGLIKLTPDEVVKPHPYQPPQSRIDSIWTQSFEKLWGPVPYGIMKGKRVFLLEEGEKLLRPDNAIGMVDGPVKYLFDVDTKKIVMYLGDIEINLPWDHQLVFISTNVDISPLFSMNEAAAIKGRLDAQVHYDKPSDNSLTAAFRDSFNNSLKFEKNIKKHAIYRNFFREKDVAMEVIKGARHAQHKMPRHVTAVTKLVVNVFIKKLDKIEPEKILAAINFKELLFSINQFWGDIAANFPIVRFGPTPQQMAAGPPQAIASGPRAPGSGGPGTGAPGPGAQGPRPLAANPAPKSGRLMHESRGGPAPPPPRQSGIVVIPSAAMKNAEKGICLRALQTLNAPLNGRVAASVLSIFIENNLMNRIVNYFYVESARTKKRVFFDRKILHETMQVIHEFVLKNKDLDGKLDVKTMKKLMLGVFDKAEILMKDRRLQRKICTDELVKCNQKFGEVAVNSMMMWFLDGEFIPLITDRFRYYKFANEDILRDAVGKVHKYLIKQNVDNVDLKYVDKIIIDVFINAREENGEDVLNDRFSDVVTLSRDDLSSSDLSDEGGDEDEVKNQPAPLKIKFKVESENTVSNFDGEFLVPTRERSSSSSASSVRSDDDSYITD